MAHETHRKGVPTCYAATAEDWRLWLEHHHRETSGVWLIIYHKDYDIPSVTYDQAVDEALCFGWVDSKPNKRDDRSFYQYFAPRNPKSNWSRKNKEKIARLMAENRMAQAGNEMVALAKERGTWDALNEVEDLTLPPDLLSTMEQFPGSRSNFEAFPRSTRRGILEWIFNAKTAPTREKRIRETAELAAQNIRANQYRK